MSEQMRLQLLFHFEYCRFIFLNEVKFHFLYFAQFPCRATKNAPLTEADAAGLRKPPSELLGCGQNAGNFSLDEAAVPLFSRCFFFLLVAAPSKWKGGFGGL